MLIYIGVYHIIMNLNKEESLAKNTIKILF